MRPPVSPSLRDFPRSLRVCYGSAPYDYKLSLTAALSLTPTPPASLRCRPASVPLSTRNHILLFRVVNAGALRVALHSPLSHTDSHVPPTHRGSSRLHPKPTALTPPPMVGATLHLLHCGRLTTAYVNSALSTARRGRQTLKPQADFRDCLSLRCTTRHPSVL